jgi:membrane-bound lytic murein transglycosylase F
MPATTLAREDYLLAMAVTHSASYNVNSAQFKVQRSSYNSLIQKYAPLSGLPWQLISAQCSQESGFDAGARSWAGACGLMQLMPSTAARFGLSRDEIFDPEKNVSVGCRLMGALMREFADVPSQYERIGFALASYNAGSGHIRDAMALARRDGANPYSWNVVSQYVLHLSEPAYYQDPVVRHGFMRGRETYNYVNSIRSRCGM